MSKGQRVGYIRVSMETQSIDRQLNNIELDKKFIDKLSGKNTDRAEFKIMMDYVREGDSVIVHSMDRLARNLVDLKTTIEVLTKKGVTVTFLKENLTFSGVKDPMSNLLLSVMGAVAEFERDIMLERQREGIAIAKLKGKFKGKKKSLDKETLTQIQNYLDIHAPIAHIAKHFKIKRPTIYNYIRDGLLTKKDRSICLSQTELNRCTS
jgi:DNA invertase Pin-like site-specific DNA recombinase